MVPYLGAQAPPTKIGLHETPGLQLKSSLSLGYMDIDNKEPLHKKCQFTCDLCKKTLSTKETLRRHILTIHIKLKPHVCEICSKSFIFERSLSLHNEIHSSVPLYECMCGERFRRRLSFKKHYKLKHSSSQITLKCVHCSKTFQERRKLRYHIQAMHPPCLFVCSAFSCKKAFSTRNLLLQHSRSHLKATFVCPTCKKVFKEKLYMEKHKASHEAVRPFKCDRCDKAYLSSSHLRLHWRRIHSEAAATYLCCICARMFKNKSDLDYHEQTHQNQNSFECELCGYKSQNKISFSNHKRSHVNTKNEKKGKDTGNHQSTRRKTVDGSKKISHHVESSLKSHPFKCVDCNKSFRTAVRANEHWRRTHRLRTDFKCSFCDCAFYNESEFVTHRNTHKEIFECTNCDYKTAFRIDLLAHKKLHTQLVEPKTPEKEMKATFKQSQIEPREEMDVNRIVSGTELKASSSEEIGNSCDLSCEENSVDKSEGKEKIKIRMQSTSESSQKITKKTTKKSLLKTKREISDSSKLPLYTHGDSLWNNVECDALSRGILFKDQYNTLSPSNKISIREETFELQHKRQSPSPRSLFSYPFSAPRERNNRNITLNCTAIDDNDEDKLLNVSSHFT